MQKLNRLNITDPYNAPGVLFKSISAEEDVPDLQHPDIYNYLQSSHKDRRQKACRVSNKTNMLPKSPIVSPVRLQGIHEHRRIRDEIGHAVCNCSCV